MKTAEEWADELQAKYQRAIECLAIIEHIELEGSEEIYVCPWCGIMCTEDESHSTDCELAAILAEEKGATDAKD